MNSSNFSIYQWVVNTPYRAICKAYDASKKVRRVQRDYLFYKKFMGMSSKRSSYNVSLYIDAVLNKAAFEIYWRLLEFKISNYCLKTIKILQPKNILNYINSNNLKKNVSSSFHVNNVLYHINFDNKYNNNVNENFLKKLLRFFLFTNKNQHFFNHLEKQCKEISFDLQNIDTDVYQLHRRFIWIEAALSDLELLINDHLTYSYTLVNYYNSQMAKQFVSYSSFVPKSKNIPYESIGLVPRSITRTLSRFQKELAGRSASLVLPEFRLAKYQAVASLQYVAFLILFPLLISILFKCLFLEPLVANFWNTTQFQVFLGFSQEEQALRRLQQVEELLWLDIIIGDSFVQETQDLSVQIHQKTLDLVDIYNQESIDTILHLFTNLTSIVIIIGLLIWGKKRLAILNSWIQEVFYSLSDTMKAFFILLLTDLCIGFHSPHGWEIFIQFLLECVGFSHNKHIISCFVSTFPVILDTVFKYWIFRHLNRISPSIVVSYHTMNE